MSGANASEDAAEAEAQRLGELERTTREYAHYSSQSFGLAGLVAGAILAMRIPLTLSGLARWNDVLSITGAMAWLAALGLSRRAYQRRGTVVAPADAPRYRRWYALPVVYVAVVFRIALLRQDEPLATDGALYWSAYLAMVGALPGLLAMASRTLRGFWDSGVLLAIMLSPWSDAFTDRGRWALPVAAWERWADWSFGAALSISVAIAAVAAGLSQHRAFRHLERRLGLLREHAS